MDELLNIDRYISRGFPFYTIMYSIGDPPTRSVNIEITTGTDWTRSIVIDKLVRSQYSQDHVEAIINNHFLNIAEWLDKKFKGEDVTFEDPEYDELQNWRKKCKEIADIAFDKYPEYKPE